MARKKSFFQRVCELEKEAIKYIEDNVKRDNTAVIIADIALARKRKK